MSSRCADDSCAVSTQAADTCLLCGARGVVVDRITLKALLTSDALRRGMPPKPRFCGTPDCSVVYFDPELGVQFTQSDLIAPVHAKHPGDPDVPVCYCFSETPRSIAERISQTGTSSVSRDIAAEVKAGHCACEVRNPKGSCCLGDIARVEKESQWQHVAR